MLLGQLVRMSRPLVRVGAREADRLGLFDNSLSLQRRLPLPLRSSFLRRSVHPVRLRDQRITNLRGVCLETELVCGAVDVGQSYAERLLWATKLSVGRRSEAGDWGGEGVGSPGHEGRDDEIGMRGTGADE